MRTKKFNLYTALLGLILAFTACQPEDYSMGDILTKDQLNFSITQNPDDPNMIILESLTPGVTPLWQTPMGRSTSLKDTVKLPFEGNYKFVYGVESPGGYVQADTFNLTLTTMNLNYVNDPLWEMLSGGVGNSKTWLLDLDENGVSKYFAGPLYFYGTENGWLAGGDAGCYGADCWNWNPDWPGNSWLMGQGDYGTMTFDLIGGANVSADHLMISSRGSEQGTYFLDADAKTLSMTDAAPLHDEGRDGQVVNWGALKVMSLTENTMQLAALRDEALSGEGPCLLVYNYISQEYADSWVPEVTEDPEPTLPDGWQDDISQTVNTNIVWKLSESNPLDWANLDGSMMNGWQAPEDYPDWLGTPDPAVYGDFSMTMNSADNSVVFVTPDGTETAGTYSLDEKGIYSFDVAVPSFTVISWASFYADANNQLRILQIEKDATGAVTGMWVGAIDASNPQYSAFHLVPSSGNDGGGEEPEGTEVAFDNSKLVIGDLEGNGNLRLELFNEYGSTKADPPLDAASIVFDNRMEITFTISGVSFIDGAAGSYPTSMILSDPNWSGYWGGGAGEVQVNGDGTYTVYCDAPNFNTAFVFVIDIQGMAADISDMDAVSVTIDKMTMY
ncbi:hypothetical protein [uncultured Draconibacterium sp.]|uniref:hypothetical protein n=1 Tax=uncultured Draconibacterium sp. TaxID=1573823 RepID=UPI002600CCEB|nr:hypothetical protein [uncultured Draconibacterium sp.]